MQTPQFSNNQFISATVMSNAAKAMVGSIASNNVKLHTPGLVGQSALSLVVNGLSVTVTAPPPFGVLFANGVSASFVGNVNGIITTTSVVDFSSLVPASGTVTVYLTASLSSVSQSAYQVIGPPVGHPDYNPNFAPYTAYLLNQNTLIFNATTTQPANNNNMLICSFTLSAGQTVIDSLDTSKQQRAGAVLSRNGEVLASDLAAGAAAQNVGQLGGALRGTLPNPTIALSQSGVVAGTYSGPMTVYVAPTGLITEVVEDDNFNVPANLSVGGTGSFGGTVSVVKNANIGGTQNIGGNFGVGGFASLNGGANVPWATTAQNPVPLGQLPYLIPLTFQNFTNVTGSRSVGSTYTNTKGAPMLVCVSSTIGNGSTGNWEIYVNGVVAGAAALSGSGGAHQTTISVMVPNGSQYQVQGANPLDNWVEIY